MINEKQRQAVRAVFFPMGTPQTFDAVRAWLGPYNAGTEICIGCTLEMDHRAKECRYGQAEGDRWDFCVALWVGDYADNDALQAEGFGETLAEALEDFMYEVERGKVDAWLAKQASVGQVAVDMAAGAVSTGGQATSGTPAGDKEDRA